MTWGGFGFRRPRAKNSAAGRSSAWIFGSIMPARLIVQIGAEARRALPERRHARDQLLHLLLRRHLGSDLLFHCLLLSRAWDEEIVGRRKEKLRATSNRRKTEEIPLLESDLVF